MKRRTKAFIVVLISIVIGVIGYALFMNYLKNFPFN